MTERDTLLETPPTPEELEQARRLAEALESGGAAGADRRALSAARFLESLSEERPGDGLARRRTRRELVARASRSRFLGGAGRWAAAAALVVLALSWAVLWNLPGRPSERLLAEREAAARSALSALSSSRTMEAGDARLASAMAEWRSERFEAVIRSERNTYLLGQAGRGAAQIPTRSPSTTTAPGGTL